VTYIALDGKTYTALASKEVILSLGAFRSPQILMLSGVGPADVLHSFAIPMVAENNGVGRNLQDHLFIPLPMEISKEAEYANSTYAPHGGFFFSDWCKKRNCTYPDLQWMCGHFQLNTTSNVAGYTCNIALTGYIKSSPGWMTLKSRDVKDYAAITPHYLGAEDDVRRFVDGIKQTCRIYNMDPEMFGPPPPELGAPLCLPDTLDSSLEEYVRVTATTVYHPVGTNKMGPMSDPNAVVADDLKVHGVEGLRVVDASIMPLIPNVNTDAPSRMIGYHAADMILEEANAEEQVVV